jgi:myo-inositol-1(or 4)-monophosphatase
MVEIMQGAALAAGKHILNHFKKQIVVTDKTSQSDLVTEVDIKAQDIIYSYITKALIKKGISKNEIGYIGEENLNQSGKYIFVIDPLDGTSNYASGLPEFGVSIAMYQDKVLEHGVIYFPIRNEFMYASRGKGAFRIYNGKITKVKLVKTKLRDTIFCGGLSRDDRLRKIQFKLYDKLFPAFRAQVAINAFIPSIFLLLDHTNMIGFIIVGRVKLWDLAASKVIIEEAGGVMVDWQGKVFELDLNDRDRLYPTIIIEKQNLQELIDKQLL